MTQSTQKHLNIYRGLDDNEKLVLQLFAYCFVPLTAPKAGTIFNKDKAFSISGITHIFQSLKNRDLIMNKLGESVIRPEIALKVLADALRDQRFTAYIPAIGKFEHNYRWTESSYRYLRDLFRKHYIGDIPDNILEHVQYYIIHCFDFLQPIADDPDFTWLFGEIGRKSLYEMVNGRLLDIHADLLPMHQVTGFILKLGESPVMQDDQNINLLMANYYMLDGNFTDMLRYIRKMKPKHQETVFPVGMQALYADNVSKAYDIMYSIMAPKKRTEMFENYEIYYVVYYILSLLGLKAEKYFPQVQKMLAIKDTTINYSNILASAMLSSAAGNQKEMEDAMAKAFYFSSSTSSLDNVFLFIVCCYTGYKSDPKFLDMARTLLDLTRNNGYRLLALELSFALKILYDSNEFEEIYQQLSAELGIVSVLSRQQHGNWEHTLNDLIGVISNKPVIKKDKITRIVYFIDINKKIIQPASQAASADGKWSKGRNIALKRLKELTINGMTDQDRLIAGTLKLQKENSLNDLTEQYYFDDEVWPLLAGHPYLFMLSNPDIPVVLEKTPPTIFVEKTDNGYALKADIVPDDSNYIIRHEIETQYKLINIDQRQRKIIQTINRSTAVIPEKGKDRLSGILKKLSEYFIIHSDVISQDADMIEGDPRIHIQLLPIGNTLKAELLVKPFNTVPPYCKPGKGGQRIISTISEKRYQVNRDLKKELRYANAILEEIQQNTSIDISREIIIFDNPRDSLFLLEILAKHQDIVVVEWPEGVKFKISRSVSMKQLNLNVKGIDYWFEVNGGLQIDEKTVLSVKELLILNSKSNDRFIELDNGDFIALSNELKERLDELQAYTSYSGDKVRISRFASMALSKTFDQAGSFSGDRQWRDFQNSLSNANTVHPDVPKTLLTELRPYQEEGFRWMVQLSEWGAGACLADDMGLGKTIQSLALLLYRAHKGPALVVCPASVVSNWISEINKFAPSLNVLLLNQMNRQDVLSKAAAFDIVVTTYGLLQSERILFSEEEWTTVILDEAHAIKNYHTKTSKAAMDIKADFRLILTGTPIQNHLTEVWNLFNFINPDLLGNVTQFNNRFVKTGEAGSKRLKKLISPFVLRRNKSSVLDELPPKTEIVQQIELSEDERVFYEALRRRAIENLQDIQSGQHIQALAEITRLRLACCNTMLVDPSVQIPSSKLATFMDIVEELTGNNHRALVFSQFVKHLNVVRQELDKNHIRYKYLDGSTSLPEREKNIQEFQSGDGDLFLISLKAGGLGLNLTAADYVIHLDPWWNPAIEDQASDRAHRIGQKRPVTIYRLVTQNTIEEKIIQLHNTKREIADSLLEGTDTPAKLSTEELLKLIMDN